MGRRGGGFRIIVGLGLLAVAGLLWADRQPDLAAQLVLLVLVPYVLVVWPFQCRERTRANTACTFSRWGILLGCHYHRWRRIRRGFSILTRGRYASESRPLGARDGVPAEVGTTARQPPIPSPDGNLRRGLYNSVILVATVAGAVAGILQVLLR